MQFEKGYIHHIFNQGNNRRKIFFRRDNYLFFLNKIQVYILPYADVLAWTLMPNHFHLMVLIRELELPVPVLGRSQGFTESETLTVAVGTAQATERKIRSFNDSIGIMLRSYTRAINKQEGASGSLFRETTKAECINCPKGIAPSFYSAGGVTIITEKDPQKEYPQVCFNYIHQNSVKAGMVKKAVDWEFSSARDYAGIRAGKLVNKVTAEKFVETKMV